MFAQVWLLFSEVERGFGLAAENAHQGSRAQHGDLQFCALPCGDMINAAIHSFSLTATSWFHPCISLNFLLVFFSCFPFLGKCFVWNIFEAIAACHDGGCGLEALFTPKNWIEAQNYIILQYTFCHFMSLSSDHFSSSIPNRSNGRANQKTTLAFQALELLSIFRAQLLTTARTKRPL